MAAGDPIYAADYLQIRRGTIDKIVCRVVASGTQTLASGGTAINFTSEDYDPYALHDTAVNPSRITPKVAGYYDCRALGFIGSTANVVGVWLRTNGANNKPSGQREAAPAAANARGLLALGRFYFNGSTDYLELMMDPSGAVATNQSAQFSCALELAYDGRIANP
jgi:hypothetical protein